MDFLFYVIYKTFLKNENPKTDPSDANAAILICVSWSFNVSFLAVVASFITNTPLEALMHRFYLHVMITVCLIICYFKFLFRKRYLKIYERYSDRNLELRHYLQAWGYVAGSFLLFFITFLVKLLIYEN